MAKSRWKGKARSQSRHAKRRALERYDLFLTDQDLTHMADAIRKSTGKTEEATFVLRQSLRVSLWDVLVKGKVCRVVYDRQRRTIVSFLPEGALGLDHDDGAEGGDAERVAAEDSKPQEPEAPFDEALEEKKSRPIQEEIPFVPPAVSVARRRRKRKGASSLSHLAAVLTARLRKESSIKARESEDRGDEDEEPEDDLDASLSVYAREGIIALTIAIMLIAAGKILLGE
ncbi:MAG TPA: hypothetical protein VGS96_09840 [Thermoanaerobaculia bacterium]|nr:hypothetical protein [Thermoanaerobaculia bacterium]